MASGDGRYLGSELGSKTSMIIMAPPQQGQGCVHALASSSSVAVSASAVSALGWTIEQLAGAGDVGDTIAIGEGVTQRMQCLLAVACRSGPMLRCLCPDASGRPPRTGLRSLRITVAGRGEGSMLEG